MTSKRGSDLQDNTATTDRTRSTRYQNVHSIDQRIEFVRLVRIHE